MRFVFLFLCAVIFQILSLVAAEKSDGDGQTAPVNDYSTRRFNEVIDAYLKGESASLQEQLISYRAKLVIAERRWAELRDYRDAEARPDAEKNTTGRSALLKAAQAEMNHYQIKIARLEEQVLREKRKAREGLLKKSKKKTTK